MFSYTTIMYVLKNLDKKITLEELASDMDVTSGTISRWIRLDRPEKKFPDKLTFECYLAAIFKYRDDCFSGDNALLVRKMIQIFGNCHISVSKLDDRLAFFEEMPDALSDDQLSQFITLLFAKAKQIHESDTKIEEEVRYCTYFDLMNMKLSSQQIIKQIMTNDRMMYGDLGPNAGTEEQWIQHLSAYPENWGFLCKEKQIIGNWSMTFLTLEQSRAVREKEGKFCANEFTAQKATESIRDDSGEVAIHLMNLSVNDGFQTEALYDTLWRTFAGRIQSLAQRGYFYRSITASVFREDLIFRFLQLGFEFKRCAGKNEQIYSLNLKNGIPEPFRRVMPSKILERMYEDYWLTPVSFRQLSHHDILSSQQLKDIAGLFYDSDEYISPPMMMRSQAKAILPRVMAANRDRLFSLDNVFAAFAGGERGRVIGIILHKRGPLNWNSGELRKAAANQKETLPATLEIVEEEYFSNYNDVGDTVTSVISCCVHPAWRSHIGVGTRMMSAFLQEHDEEIQLYVLKETTAAVRIYERNGFTVEGSCFGFSVDETKELPCSFMVRSAREENRQVNPKSINADFI